MELFSRVVNTLEYYVWDFGIPYNGETIPLVVIALLGTGVFLTLRLAFVQFRRFGHGVAVTSGKYDDPEEPGDVSHFQALTTALSATVGIGNIAGVALALHWGGPGALFWMWVTALLGMAVKYTEVTLAQHYRTVDREAEGTREGSVAGGPMYYIERGLGPSWKPLAIFFAVMLGTTAFLTGNAVQANTVADAMFTNFGMPVVITGLITAGIVFAVIVGGIRRIGEVTAILAPVMAAIYVLGALIIIFLNVDQVLPTFSLIFREAFNPSAGVAGTGTGAFLVTLMWGVRRGLYSNEAGQGSAPIAHAAAKTDEPVSEGVVALLEPFIDTIVICTMTGLVILMTGAWGDRVDGTALPLAHGNISFVAEELETGRIYAVPAPAEIPIVDGQPAVGPADPVLAWHNVAVGGFYLDAAQTQPLTGVIRPYDAVAIGVDGQQYTMLYGPAVRTGAPLTMLGFRRGLAPLGDWGHYIVLLAVLLFAVSTSIAWSYYGDRCAKYLLGNRAILPYRVAYTGMHFFGAVVPLAAIWAMGDVMLGIVILPNLLALILLAPVVAQLTRSYFERRPWIENAEAHRRAVEARKRRKRERL
jgi:alanine or glycine:cation symporter, AGCS family